MEGVKATVSAVIEEAVDCRESWVAGEEGGCLVAERCSFEGGEVFAIESQRALAFVEDGGVKKGLEKPIVGNFREAGIALVEAVGAEADVEGGDAVGGAADEGEEVVGCAVESELRGVEVFEEKFVAEDGESGVEGVFGVEGFPERETLGEIDAEAVGIDGPTWDAGATF